VFNVVFGLLIAYRYSNAAGFAGGMNWGLAFVWMIFGLFAQLMIRFFFCIWIFWTDRSWALNRLYFEFYALATKPDTLYPPIVRYTILTLLPFGFIGSVPARALLHGLTIQEYIWTALVMFAFAAVNGLLWHIGLKRYQSASS
jgi:ABC-2 type transport system permease protein